MSFAIPLGIYQAIRRNTIGDYVMTGFSFIFYSMPIFLLAFLLIVLFSIQFHVFPAEAPQTSSAVAILEDPRALFLPVLSLSLITIASFSRYIRSSGIENMAQDFIRTARAKGLPQRLVVTRHLLRNSLMPIVTLLGLSLPAIVGGALITEQVFNYPGMGLQFFKAAEDQDYAILIGFTIFIGISTVVGQPPRRHRVRDARPENQGGRFLVAIRSNRVVGLTPADIRGEAPEITNGPEGGDVAVAPARPVAADRRRLRAEPVGHDRPRDVRR